VDLLSQADHCLTRVWDERPKGGARGSNVEFICGHRPMRCRSGNDCVAGLGLEFALGLHSSQAARVVWESAYAARRRCRVGSQGVPVTKPTSETRLSPGDPVLAYAELARIVLGAQPLGAVLRRIAEIARDLIPRADEVSITMLERDRARTVGFAGDLASALDERQYTSGRGPCLDAAVTGQTIAIDTAADTLYPEFSRQARRSGIQQTLAVGLPSLQGTTGAVNIYSRTSDPFSDQSLDTASTFAEYAAIALANAALYAGAVQEAAQLKEAMASRAVIEQAKGMIMRDEGCTADEAFDVLRGSSSRSHVKLRDVAQALVAVPGTPVPRLA
jgi:hypothetical protein